MLKAQFLQSPDASSDIQRTDNISGLPGKSCRGRRPLVMEETLGEPDPMLALVCASCTVHLRLVQ